LILAEYEKNKKRVGDGDVKGQSQKLAIDAKRLNLAETRVLGLDKIRRKDSGAICGPKAAFLGELKHHFPDNVVRGAVIPFGVYASHFKRCKVAIPKHVATKKIAVRAGTPLGDFVRKTYDLFFNNMLNNPKLSSTQLAEWIKPRLDIIRHSILRITLDPSFVQALKKELAAQGLFADRNMEVLRGVFVRSDTNVEDMPNFSGAGLNLTIFNLTAFKDVL
ncbi:MAG: hypothetical protein GY849_08110, partial [Deltaproteobacteria bacterium]|nr:hypothetical protein [Deltaproteobacteria bacterium]